MSRSLKSSNTQIIEKLFFKMLPVQSLIFAVSSVNVIVDGAIAGQFIDAATVGVIGLYYSMACFFMAAGNVLLGGTAVLCGRYMGRGELEKTQGVFSLNLTLSFLVGAFFTLASFLVPGVIARILGANDVLAGPLTSYIRGFAIGIIPMLLAQQLAAFLQMEGQNMKGYLGIGTMLVSNIALDIILIVWLKMGVFGLALATSLSNILYFLILLPYFLGKKTRLHYHPRESRWKDAGPMVLIGSPGALLIFCISLRGIVLNRILLAYAGSDGLSAMSALNMVNGLFIAYCLGNGAVVRMLSSIFYGEEDKHSLRALLKVVLTKGMLVCLLITGLVLLASSFLVQLFFPDRSSQVYQMGRQLFMIYGACIPLILLCQVSTNYFQALGHTLFVNVVSVFDGFFAMIIPALILAPLMGATGIWLSSPIGIVLTLLLLPLYALLYWKRRPRNLDEWMFLKPGFGAAPEDSLELSLRNLEEVADSSEKLQHFCEAHEMEKKIAYHAALCMEEMAANVVQHGFTHDQKPHSLTLRAVRKEDGILLRLKDDCTPFDPGEMARIQNSEEGLGSIGIRMVQKVADEMTYQRMLGLNVLSILIKEEDLRTKENTDFLLEKTLKKLDPALHGRFRDTVFTSRRILTRFKLLFPEYTDHSEFHSLDVIDACNRLIGPEQVGKLNQDEIYILLMACYLHDVGMGIGEKDYEEFKAQLGEKEYFESHPQADRADFVRDKHNEFSGAFIEKYADLFECPSPEHAYAIRQVARGHRKTDLFDEKEYPAAYPLPDGNRVCLPYLAALVRIADEIDVVATRNPLLLYDIGALTDEKQILENKKLSAVRSMKMTGETLILTARTQEAAVEAAVREMADKMQRTLDLCRDVIHKRTDFKLSQKKVVLQFEKD
ncbi:MAG: ATP-binding protein [Lachnospiraceae bacterium]|nr:ATP-binding protein [Lachnospiraceae bacterium]